MVAGLERLTCINIKYNFCNKLDSKLPTADKYESLYTKCIYSECKNAKGASCLITLSTLLFYYSIRK